jgi:hypothetical protein
VQSFVRSQEDPKNPTGTTICVSSSLAGRIFPGFSAYSIGKLGEQKLGEYVDAGMSSPLIDGAYVLTLRKNILTCECSPHSQASL